MGCLRITHDQRPELRVVHAKKGVASNDWVKRVRSSYLFGMLMPDRHDELSGRTYAYGFQGQERDDEVKGAGNAINFKFRMHDPRLGRFFAVDPLAAKYPHYTPYSFSGNKVIHAVEIEGLEEKLVTQALYDQQLGQTFQTVTRSEQLLNLWHSVNRADRVETHKVVYGVVTSEEQQNERLGGYTADLKNIANWVQKIRKNESFDQLSKDYKKNYLRYIALFKRNDLVGDIEEIANSEKEVFGIFLNPNAKGGNNRKTFSLLHEIDAHLSNKINGIEKSEGKEHADFYNYGENPELLKKYPRLLEGRHSPPYDDIPENSRAGEIKKEIEKVNDGDR